MAVAAPLRSALEYLPPAGVEAAAVRPGQRVRVPLGASTRLGVVVGHAAAPSVAAARLRRAEVLVDAEPLLPEASLRFLAWAAQYFHHPIGEVLAEALPARLRGARAARRHAPETAFRAVGGSTTRPDAKRAPRQAALYEALARHPGGLTREHLARLVGEHRAALRALVARGLVEACTPEHAPAAPPVAGPELNAEQREALACIDAAHGRFGAFLLDGITGSGKTEVYLALIARALARGHQALVLLPEIGLTPLMARRLDERVAGRCVVLHSGLGAAAREHAWLEARDGVVEVVIGTRSAVFTPLPRLGLVVVDEEHDPSFKQQEGFRYSARDLAVALARQRGVPVVLGSATPSLESLRNAARGRYRRLVLSARAHRRAPPEITLLDVRGQRMQGGLSNALLHALAERLARGQQSLLFLNRRGYAPVLMCHACGWLAGCRRCDAHLVYHSDRPRLQCHHCDAVAALPRACPGCGAPHPSPVGLGTQRVSEALAEHFPDARIRRVDRDTLRNRGAFDTLLTAVESGEVDILIGTQMLAKGHHFPGVTLVAVLDADAGLFGADFRATERMAQLIVQVAGRAGRGEAPGEVLVQTHHPQHPMLRALVAQDFAAFAGRLMAERREASLPPFASWALLRAEAPERTEAYRFLERARAAAGPPDGTPLALLGPVAAPMERRAGRHRVQLLVEAPRRADLHRFLDRWLPALDALKHSRRLRWSLDVDPQDTV